MEDSTCNYPRPSEGFPPTTKSSYDTTGTAQGADAFPIAVHIQGMKRLNYVNASIPNDLVKKSCKKRACISKNFPAARAILLRNHTRIGGGDLHENGDFL